MESQNLLYPEYCSNLMVLYLIILICDNPLGIYGEDGIDPTRSIGSKSLDIKTIIEEVRRDE